MSNEMASDSEEDESSQGDDKKRKKDKKKLKSVKKFDGSIEEYKKKEGKKKKPLSLTLTSSDSKLSRFQKKERNSDPPKLKAEKVDFTPKSYHPKNFKSNESDLKKWQVYELAILSSGIISSRWEQHQAKLASKSLFIETSSSSKKARKSKLFSSQGGKDDSDITLSDSPSNNKFIQKAVTPRNKIGHNKNYSESDRVTKFEEEDNDENLRYAEIDGEMQIVGGTIEKLIQKLTSHEYTYPAYLQCFMLTYQQFMTPQELLALLKLRWNSCPSKQEDVEEFNSTKLLPIRIRVLNILKLWIGQYGHDIIDDKDMTNSLMEFLNEIEGFSSIVESVKKYLQMKIDGLNTELIEYSENPPESYNPPSEFTTNGSILDLHPEEVARQITLIEFNLFKKIHYRELLGVRWTKANKLTESPNVLAMISFTNHFVNWIITNILKEEDVITRCLILSRFITIGKICYKKYNNFNAAMEVLSALRSSSIFRLKHTWKYLSDESWNDFEELVELFESDNNFKKYRKAIEKSVPPCLPYLGRYLSELMFLDEKHPNKIVDTELINFGKMYLISDILTRIHMFQTSPYCIKGVNIIQDFLSCKDNVLDQKESYKRSLLLEPRENDGRHSIA